MKRLHYLLIALFVFIGTVNISAQNLDRNTVSFSRLRLPLTPLPENIKFYNPKLDLGYIYHGDSKTEVEQKLQNAIKIDGLERGPAGEDCLTIMARLETYYKSEVRFETVQKSEKRGDETVKVTYHYLTFDYKYPLYYELVLPGSYSAESNGFINNSNEMKSYTSAEYRNKGDLYKWWNENYKSLQAKLRQDLLNSNASSLAHLLDNRFGYKTVKDSEMFFTVKKFKKFEYTDLDEAYSIAKQGLEMMQEDQPLPSDAARSTMSKAIAIWVKALDEADLENRKTRINSKVAGAIANNMVNLYTLMGEFDKAQEIINKADEEFKKDGWTYMAQEKLNDLKKRIEANQITIQ
ncbi:hypothetical protein OO013_08595 [Mangrovivirga sp. M17]|uniref:Tetratricopeptide repeat protein n=1 Tax=Mangrovivirga halotolerans TaxID=2993936 RepID=A0ABT3RQR9_9BACT|nr:hypothetical protein [Mangrovivirga halotolerans]MCX2743922.1 hypothetical protein [Mangrovivirga halotolerans]